MDKVEIITMHQQGSDLEHETLVLSVAMMKIS
jgi:hypothetical protein